MYLPCLCEQIHIASCRNGSQIYEPITIKSSVTIRFNALPQLIITSVSVYAQPMIVLSIITYGN